MEQQKETISEGLEVDTALNALSEFHTEHQRDRRTECDRDKERAWRGRYTNVGLIVSFDFISFPPRTKEGSERKRSLSLN
jgi:hypothetical protein